MVVEEPGLWSETVRGVLEADAEIEVRGEIDDCAQIYQAVDRTGADVVVWLTGDMEHVIEPCRRLLGRLPRLRVLAVKDGTKASVWRMRPTRRRLGRLSPETLVREVRGGL